jgi:hypothetical protein
MKELINQPRGGGENGEAHYHDLEIRAERKTAIIRRNIGAKASWHAMRSAAAPSTEAQLEVASIWSISEGTRQHGRLTDLVNLLPDTVI